MNETEVKKRKVEEVHHISSSSESQSFVMFCKDEGTKSFQLLNCCKELGKYILGILICIIKSIYSVLWFSEYLKY